MSDPQNETIRIVLVDDHRVIREGLREFIETRPGMRVVGDAGDRRSALEVVGRERPDVVVLDLDLGGVSGLDLLPEILSAAPAASVIILTGVRDAEKRDRGASETDPEAAKIATLTQTERVLIEHLGKGLDNRQIAERLHMAESTVRNSLTRIYDKLDVKGGRLALLVYAYQHGLVKPSS